MGKKKIIEIILIGVCIIVFIVGVMVMVFHSYTVRSSSIKDQMEKMYGLSVDSAGVKIVNDSFSFKTAEGINVYGTCDWFGKVKTDSYVNYFYADECADHIRDEIGDCFDEALFITDDLKLSELAKIQFDACSISSYDDYVAATAAAFDAGPLSKTNYRISVRVYIKENEDLDHVEDAIAILESNNEYADVYFYVIDDDIYESHEFLGIYTYYVGDYMDVLFYSLGDKSFDRFLGLIYHNEGQSFSYSQWRG